MKILVLGDPHGSKKVRKIPIQDVDLILLTGDLGNADLARSAAFLNIQRKKKGLEEIEISPKKKKEAFMQVYISSLKVVEYLAKFAQIFTIYGNVESDNKETKDYSKEIGLKLPYLTDALLKIKGVKIINNKKTIFKNIRIGGLRYFIDTSWVREFRPDNYSKRMDNAKKDTIKAKKILEKFGSLDILVCHQPPYGILDKVSFKKAPKDWKGKHAGSKTILNYIKKYKPKYVFCGHIHEGQGFKKIGSTMIYNLGVAGYKIIKI